MEWGSGGGRGERGGIVTYLAGFVLGDFVLGVLSTLFALAVGAAGFGNLGCKGFGVSIARLGGGGGGGGGGAVAQRLEG